MNRMTMISLFLMVMTLVARGGGVDCPRFRGPAGDGQFPDTGLQKQWPANGPKVAWTARGLGQGYSSATVANGTVYVTGMDDQKQGRLLAFGLDGVPKWKTAYGPELGKQGMAVAGTRGTPTIDGERVLLVTGLGKLVIFDAAKGQVLKTIDLLELCGAKQAQFGFAEAVLADGQKLICTPGGPDASLAALDKNTGAVLWKTGKVMWNAPAVGMAVVIAADGMLYVYGDDGKMYLVKPNATAFEPVSQFTISEGTNEHWAHPTIANGRLYVRHGDALVVYDIKG